jgi:peptidoglycan-associated lipoprotein
MLEFPMSVGRCRAGILAIGLLLGAAGCAEQPAPPPPAAGPPPAPVAAAPAEQAPPPPAPSAPPVAASPAPQPAPVPPPSPSQPSRPPAEFTEHPDVKDVFFDAGHVDVGPHGSEILKQNARWLIEHADYVVLIEGHSDYHGTREKNEAVGLQRAKSAMLFLAKEGVSETRIQIVSYGEDRPVCREKTPACAAKNRRVHFLVKPR